MDRSDQSVSSLQRRILELMHTFIAISQCTFSNIQHSTYMMDKLNVRDTKCRELFKLDLGCEEISKSEDAAQNFSSDRERDLTRDCSFATLPCLIRHAPRNSQSRSEEARLRDA